MFDLVCFISYVFLYVFFICLFLYVFFVCFYFICFFSISYVLFSCYYSKYYDRTASVTPSYVQTRHVHPVVCSGSGTRGDMGTQGDAGGRTRGHRGWGRMQRVTQAEGCRDKRMMRGCHGRDTTGRTRGHRERDSDAEDRTRRAKANN